MRLTRSRRSLLEAGLRDRCSRDRKQLQIAGGIAAHGAQQTEVSENKMRAQQSRRNNKCNAGEVITEGNRHLDKNSKTVSTTINQHDDQTAFEKSRSSYMSFFLNSKRNAFFP
ncbi:unnamed protein product [Lasius platythorax]|uniref:Uncharacterized protein n=1 Tax=Lasius platythorax TaxID=488582 RepID=A0AAV2PC62_9HYME